MHLSLSTSGGNNVHELSRKIILCARARVDRLAKFIFYSPDGIKMSWSTVNTSDALKTFIKQE